MQKIILGILCMIAMVVFPLQASAEGSVPYDTETLSADGSQIKTQTAYKPLGQLLPDEEMTNPEDIFIDSKGLIYIADSGTKKIIVANEDNEVVEEVGKGVLKDPTGVYVDEHGDIYVADYEKEKIFRFSPDGKLEKTIGKPKSPLFGSKSSFKPQKVGVDRRGNIYIISEGSTNGIIQLSGTGTFLGYYGVNNTEVSFKSVLENLLTTEGQKAKMFRKTPPAPGNIAIDQQGLIYSVTQGTKNEVIKKLNVAGQNMLPDDISDESSMEDVTVDQNGNIFAVSSKAKIYEFDSFGNLLFVFGGEDDGSNRLGLFKQPSGIAVDNLGRLYIADKERGMIQVFDTTSFTNKVHEGIALYKDGLYVKSQKYWKEVLQLNSSFGLAHTAMGKAYYKQQDYPSALDEFEFANDIQGYSDAYWEIRHEWMQKNLGTVLLLILGFIIIYYVLKYLDKKKKVLAVPRAKWNKVKKVRLIKELFFLFSFFKKPVDSFYYLKRKKYASILSASILYLVLIIEYLVSRFQTGLIFSSIGQQDVSLFGELLKLIIPLALFIIINYLVSTINDGEGRLKDIYIGTIYALAPYIVFILPITFLTNILTLNEAFIYIFSIRIVYAWCLVILFIMVMEIHNYVFSETVRNFLFTIFGMVIMILVVFIVFVLVDQVYDFVYSVIKEAVLRV
ncbi:hypothetical protein [Falsibacillus albus]|uniref:Uncharacterized protein n=1 Tax=Falsibacillus albus TaxID=2478915 RepID=A0A3L7K1F2_9BACI|nr:hypothetical protein [Falsibacillus albus]RLQ96620.1 hypothetical protein D9X91_05810 [Falsibacillus albus]